MTAILAVETSTLTASVAILVDGAVAIERHSDVNNHSELLLPLIDECLQATKLQLTDLHTIAVGAGPGSFTGLRIGMATVKGLCFATGLSITPVSSLAALAMDYKDKSPHALLVPVLDARRKEIYAGFYRQEGDKLVAQGEERVLPPEELAGHVAAFGAETVLLFGDGATKYQTVLAPIGVMDLQGQQTPTASAVGRLALQRAPLEEIATAAPTYVRLPEAQIKFPDGNPGGTFSRAQKSSTEAKKRR